MLTGIGRDKASWLELLGESETSFGAPGQEGACACIASLVDVQHINGADLLQACWDLGWHRYNIGNETNHLRHGGGCLTPGARGIRLGYWVDV